ncbi:MAG TPA: hypothetical protein VFV30_10605 [Novosphingobium sp.]|nr:hypothetical protein [Novosphingobium sp.]
MIEALLLILAAESGAADAAVTEIQVAEPTPSTMTPKEIRAFNAKLPRGHRYYIRCVARNETGSLVKQVRTCRTNEQWARAEETGNDNARETAEAMRGKASNSN